MLVPESRFADSLRQRRLGCRISRPNDLTPVEKRMLDTVFSTIRAVTAPRPWLLVGLVTTLLSTYALGQATYTLPADRATTWKPGVTYNGGIPARTTVCASIAAGAAVSTIQSALNACPSGQVVSL